MRWPFARKAKPYPLTEREMDILRLVAKGQSNKEIGYRAKISEQTVKNHNYTIMRKLGVTNRTQAVVEGIKRGLIRV